MATPTARQTIAAATTIQTIRITFGSGRKRLFAQTSTAGTTMSATASQISFPSRRSHDGEPCHSVCSAAGAAVLFCGMILLVAIWFSGFGLGFSTTDAALATAAGRIGIAAVCLLPAAIYDFTATALRLRSSRRRLVNAAWIIAAAFALLALF